MKIKAVILAGGLGTRISEESVHKPKPMIEVGGKPILWHILKIYSSFGINDFIICCGYKGYLIKEYFANYFLHMSDVTFDMEKNMMHVHYKHVEPWRVTLVDTGEMTMTGGRLKMVEEYVKDDDFFCFTYGDGLANIDIKNLIHFHRKNGLDATVTAVHPPARFGSLEISNNVVDCFAEKPNYGEGLINGGFFVLSPKVISLIKDIDTVWEREPMELLATQKQLGAYVHNGFWQPMDTLRDKNYLEELWSTGRAPWKIWG